MLKFIESDPWLFAIASGLVVAVIWALLVKFTSWAGPTSKVVGRGLLAVLRWIFSVRVTTEPRIRRRIDRAVEKATQPGPDLRFWQWTRDRRPGVWLLENHTGEVCTVTDIVFDTDAGWDWKMYPNFPLRVRNGEHIELRGRISVPTFAPYRSENPGATVRWADSHGDEAAIWAPFEDGFRFF